MLLVWRGLGCLVPLIAIMALVAMEALMRATTGNLHFYQAHGWPKLLGLWLAATAVWLLGRSLIAKREDQNHSFMGAPVHVWAPVLVVAGVALAFMSEEPPVFSSSQIAEQKVSLVEDCHGECTQADGTAEQCHAKCACVVDRLAARYPSRESWSEFVELDFTDHAKHAAQVAALRAQCGFR